MIESFLVLNFINPIIFNSESLLVYALIFVSSESLLSS